MIRLLKKKSFSWQIDCTVTGLGERNWHLKDFLCEHVKSRDKEEDRCPSALHSAAAKDTVLLWIQQIWVSTLANNWTVCFLKRNIRLLLSPIIFPLGLSTARQARWWKTTRPLKFCKCPSMRSLKCLESSSSSTPTTRLWALNYKRDTLCHATISAHTCIENVRINMFMQLN